MKAWPESKGRHGSQDRTCRREGESLWSKAKLFPKRELLLLVRTLLFVYLVMSLVPTASEAAAASTTRFRRRSYDQLLTAAAAEDDLEDRMMGDSPYTLPINFKMKFVSSEDSRQRPNYSRPRAPASDEEAVEVYRRPGSNFVRIYHPHTMTYLKIERDGSLATTNSERANDTLFQIERRSHYIYLENILTCRYICLRGTGEVYTQPSNFDKTSGECQLVTHTRPKSGISLADVITISSKVHSNSSHSLTMEMLFQPRGRGRGRWQADYLSRLEVAPPKTMKFDIFDVDVDAVKQTLHGGSTTFLVMSTKHSRHQQYCPSAWSEASRLHNHHDHHDNGDQIRIPATNVARFKAKYEQCAQKATTLEGRATCRNYVRKQCRLHLDNLGLNSSTCNFNYKTGSGSGEMVVVQPEYKTNKVTTAFFEPWTLKKCWKLKAKSQVRACARRQKKTCLVRQSTNHPSWSSDKVRLKCEVGKCVTFNRWKNRRLRRRYGRQRWNKKAARRSCRRRILRQRKTT